MTGWSRPTVVGVVAVVAVGVAVTLGLRGAGSPSAERSRRIDERRVEDLRRIAETVDLYWTRQGGLPESLDPLVATDGEPTDFRDPVTAARYEYRTLTGSSFELCAQFDTESAFVEQDNFWRHPANRYCFKVDAEPVERKIDTLTGRVTPRRTGRQTP
ncbi:MAG: hypothetical protein ABGY72_00715 [bacterium]